jgi:trans-AT polyketide synthase/acyltransferase/oxidoreductase domain-containing protein
MKVAFVFAGQGAQRAGMGAELFARYPAEVRAAGRLLGWPVEEVCAGHDGRLNRTEFTQPALFVVNALAFRDQVERTGLRPDYLAGHSLGELNALHAAGAFDFETGVRIVARRGELMARCGPGAMAALLGEREPLQALLAETGTGVWLANDNTPRQVVVSGTPEAVAALEERVRGLGLADVVPLPVSGAFHSPLMAPAHHEFLAFLREQPLQPPAVPVVSNATARPYRAEELGQALADVLVRPVRWLESIRWLLRQGPLLFQEAGPGRVATSLVRQIVHAEPSPAA